MENHQIVLEIIKEVYPLEYVIAGEDATIKIIKSEGNDIGIYEPKGGSNFDIAGALTLISTSIIVIKNIIEIYQKLFPKGEKKSAKEVEGSIKEQLVAKNIKFEGDKFDSILEILTKII